MKRKLLILFACFIGIKVAAQVDVMHYKVMYDTIVTTLNMDKAYVSDSLWEFEYRQLQSCKVISRDSCRVLEERRLKEKMFLGNHSDEPYKYFERDAETGYDYFGARFYASQLGHWLSVDPLSDKYPHISPYAYAAWNPIKYIDPDGRWVETAWDIANIGMDVASLKSNINDGNVGGAIVDGLGLVLDAGATLVPCIPGGAGTAIKAYRAADRVSDAGKLGKAIDKVKKTYQTYIKRNPKTGEIYVGRTSGTKSPLQNVKARDSKHHKNADGFGPAEMVNSSTNKDAIRGQEQRLIDQYGGAKSSGGTSGNAINGVSPNNPNAEKYNKAAKSEFGE